MLIGTFKKRIINSIISRNLRANNILMLMLSTVLLYGCANKEPIQAPEPFLPIPNNAQLNWHKAEYIMFAHFGMKTFYPSDDHMGYGKEDPKKFNPAKFDARQWVKAAKAGGFKGIVLTAKHHDGFCNWQEPRQRGCFDSHNTISWHDRLYPPTKDHYVTSYS